MRSDRPSMSPARSAFDVLRCVITAAAIPFLLASHAAASVCDAATTLVTVPADGDTGADSLSGERQSTVGSEKAGRETASDVDSASPLASEPPKTEDAVPNPMPAPEGNLDAEDPASGMTRRVRLPRYFGQLKLQTRQREKIQDVLRSYLRDRMALRTQLEALEAAQERDLREQLTPSQRRQLDQLRQSARSPEPRETAELMDE